MSGLRRSDGHAGAGTHALRRGYRKLNRWLESGAVHHSDLAGLPHLVCLYSLLIRLQNNSPA